MPETDGEMGEFSVRLSSFKHTGFSGARANWAYIRANVAEVKGFEFV